MTARPTLRYLLAPWAGVEETADDAKIDGVSLDSRRVRPGDLFFAYPGITTDGRRYIDDAISRGAVAIAYDPADFQYQGAVTGIAVPGLQYQVGVIAARYFGHPSSGIEVIGITGTNGKTSCAILLSQALEELGLRCGVIGTLGIGFRDRLAGSSHTTPDPVTMQRSLRQLADQGASHVCVEVSSHALTQGRVAGVQFDAALFTNLSRDHLDYHSDFDAYAQAKASLFERPELRLAVVNCGDEFGAAMAAGLRRRTWTYNCEGADVYAADVAAAVTGLTLVMHSSAGRFKVRSRLVGLVNVPNLLAVAAMLLANEYAPPAIARAIARLASVPGRMELFSHVPSRPKVVVDYAHSPDALERTLRSIRVHCRGRLWCLFGCGGDRDRGKRPLMGAVAEALADRVVLTDDNPRHEEPAGIVADIMSGMAGSPMVIHDRAAAIQWAISQAVGDDWLLVAGKGHETIQQVGSDRLPLDDRVVVSQCLERAA
jgi:UDP-N-acetylmuramoyl-L-alanyl-D-glutamate--2,6-diaminopimelate ligase